MILRRSVLVFALLWAGYVPAETITTQSGLFRVHYAPGAKETAKQTAIIAEDVFYQLVTAYSLHERFRPIDILVTDDIDAGNGFADYYQNQLVVWATNLDTDLRGTNQWLRNVVTHELAHIFSLKLARRYPFRYGLISASVLNSSVADIGMGIPIYSLVTPAWWVEGIAQYEADRYGGDRWDTHRDMLLRMATLENDLLSYDEMGVFAHNWLKSEMVYNQGYALTSYISRNFGANAPRNLAKNTGYVTFNTALRENLRLTGQDLYDRWVADIRARYSSVRDSVGAIVEGNALPDEGSYETAPAISPDGTQIAYLSARGEDFLLTKPRIRHLARNTVFDIDRSVRGNLAWFPDGGRIAYAKFGRGTYLNDLYVYDIARKEETRITSRLRARDPAVSPDGKWIAFVSGEDGGTRLGIVRADGSEIRWLTNSMRSPGPGPADIGSKTSDLIQFYTPKWSPDGKSLLFSVFRDGDRDIGIIGTQGPYFSVRDALSDSAAFPDTLVYPAGSGFRLLVHTEADERDPAWLPDGSGFVFSADYDIATDPRNQTPEGSVRSDGGSRPFRIFNLYLATLPTDSTEEVSYERLTNVLGGAFQPAVAPDGKWLAYVGYHANNFSLYILPLAADGQAALRPPFTGDAVPRSYQHIAKSPPASQLFHVGQTTGMRTLVGWVPVLRFGPSVIGDRFSVNHVGLGLLAGIEDQMGARYYFGSGEISKNIGKREPASTGVFLYGDQGLRPLLTTESGLSPRLYGYGARQEICAVTERARTTRASAPGAVLGANNETIPLNPLSRVELSDSVVGWDNYRYLYGGLGIRAGVGSRQTAAFELGWQNYYVDERLDRRIDNYSVFLDNSNPPQDVTALFPWGNYGYPNPGTPLIWDQRPQFSVAYFRDRTASFRWAYAKITPTVDDLVNPTGGRVITASYSFHRVSVMDSLAGTNYDANYNQIDPTRPLYSQVDRHFSANELVLSYEEYIRLPGILNRTTLALQGVAAYFDRALKYYDPNDEGSNLLEGWAYWPLRYRLGGGGTLRGYPYFSHEGSKMAFFRASYVFPLLQHHRRQFLSFFHDRTYGALFVETGSTWNWTRLKDAWIARDDFLWDLGAELRISGRMFHYMPVVSYVAVARRMKDVPYPFVDYERTAEGAILFRQPDRYRVYIGAALALGGGGGAAPHAEPRFTRTPQVLMLSNPARQPANGAWESPGTTAEKLPLLFR
ncbi:MAG TPA: hypothetical protein PK251_09615 [Candidatus Latescibacteria bacterium]|nr:hypothetical protein [Candidatus Latescibacterota bacterium]HOS64994.1 hypothetical protein [Candidatus Latescibacterota bacterium]HPK74168.1 hypothetical protein [Candidatus Latescibacterota bacterium]